MKAQQLKCNGFSLIEMIMAIVVLASASAILLSFNQNVAKSADPMILQQSIIIAQGYLEEVMLNPFVDPDGGDTGSCEEASRNLYDDVNDYGCINDTGGALPQFGPAYASLAAYNVNVVIDSAAQPAGRTRIDVTVTHDTYAAINTTLTAYRYSYY